MIRLLALLLGLAPLLLLPGRDVKAELLREQIDAALEAWSPCAFQQHLPMAQK